jgi:hypothetical protein
MPDPETYLDPAHWHPAANIFPLIEGEEFAALVEDIRTKGLLNPIVLYEGLLLDGRNRLRACVEAGVAPRWTTWQRTDGVGPVAWVISQNKERRHLTSSQWAACGIEAGPLLMDELEAEAAARQRAQAERGKEGGRGHKKTLQEPAPEGFQRSPRKKPAPQSSERAAKLFKTNRKYVEEARRLKQQDPKTFAEVKAGKKSLKQVAKERKQREAREKAAAQAQTAKGSAEIRKMDALAFLSGLGCGMCRRDLGHLCGNARRLSRICGMCRSRHVTSHGALIHPDRLRDCPVGGLRLELLDAAHQLGPHTTLS